MRAHKNGAQAGLLHAAHLVLASRALLDRFPFRAHETEDVLAGDLWGGERGGYSKGFYGQSERDYLNLLFIFG